MAKAITSSFTLKHEARVPTSPGTEAIPIGSLIDVGDAQALEIESVDYIWQGYDTNGNQYLANPDVLSSSPAAVAAQLCDKNPGSLFISAADNNLVSSGQLYIGASVMSSDSDFFPDDFMKGNTGRFVVNDELYLTTDASTSYDSNREIRCTVQIRAKVVKLTTRDWMAISLETVQNE